MTAVARAPFGQRLQDAIAEKGQLCVGIDPTAESLSSWSLTDTTQGLREFSLRLMEAAIDNVPIVKPQSAYFERFGAPGIAVLTEVCQMARDAGLLVLLDAKRGDIGSTNSAYADAYLRATSPIAVDALTVTAYTGMEALRPLIDVAVAEGSGLFVLVRTSNPEGRTIQMATTTDGRQVSKDLLAQLSAYNAGQKLGSLGCVFGATVDTEGYDLEALNAFVLSPGLGTQGATPEDLGRRFTSIRTRILPTASRSIAQSGPTAAALTDSIRQLSARCTEALSR